MAGSALKRRANSSKAKLNRMGDREQSFWVPLAMEKMLE